MTLPNRVGYVPGEERGREMASEADAKSSDSEVGECGEGIGALRSDLCAMLAAAAPAQATRAPEFAASGPVSGPEAVAHRKVLAVAARCCLEQDELFEQVWSRVSMRCLIGSAAVDLSDAFEAVLDQLPYAPIEPAELAAGAKRTGMVAECLDGVLVDDDGLLRSKLEDAALQLCEWSKRRQLAVEHPPRSTSPTEMLREGVSIEAAARKAASSESAGRQGGSPSMAPTLALYGFDLSARSGTPKRRANLNKTAKEMLRVWFEAHVHHPYPTEEEKEWLAHQGGITLEQVNNWFINTRGRKWKPMLKRLMAEKQKGECKLLDDMVQRMTEPYHREA